MFRDTMRLDSEVATVVPVQSGTRFERAGLDQYPEFGHKHNDFFTACYFRTCGGGRSSGSYRKLLAQFPATQEPDTQAVCQLVHVAGPQVCTIENFGNLVGPAGPLPQQTATQFPFVVLRNFAPLQFDCGGLHSHLINDPETHADELLSLGGRCMEKKL